MASARRSIASYSRCFSSPLVMSAYHSAVISSTSRRAAREARMLRLSSFVVAVLAVGLLPVTAAAQQRIVIFGVVQWTNPNSIQIIADNGQSVSIDISQLPQSSYQG